MQGSGQAPQGDTRPLLKLELPQGSSAAHRFGAVVDPVVRKKRMDSGVDGVYAFIDSQHAC